MYIEDIFEILAKTAKLGMFDRDIVKDFSYQISIGKNFTEKQAGLMVKILKKYQSQLELTLSRDISTYIDNPTFKMPFKLMNYQKTMKICDHTLYKKAIKVEFPYNDAIINSLKEKRTNNPSVSRFSHYDKDEKSWFFALLERNIASLIPVIKEFNFDVDDELLTYITKVEQIQKNMEQHIPMLVKHNEKYKIINLAPSIHVPETTNLIESLFIARKYGINLWDDKINDELNSSTGDPVTVNFLKSECHACFDLDLTKNSLNSLSPILEHLFPCLVIIPGGTELEKLKMAHELFNSMNLQNNEMSVLFRLQNATNADFNQFVRDTKLNSPLNENTKVVFLSQHFPKTILSPLKKFNSVLNFNYFNVHHKLAVLIRNQENVINILEKSKQRRLNFALM